MSLFAPARARILAALQDAVKPRPVCWASVETSTGDFEGRAATIEIFDVPAWDQRALLATLRARREEARQLLGEEIRVVFHTPEATTRHYSRLRPVGYSLDIHAPRDSVDRRRSSGDVIDEDPLLATAAPRRRVA